MDKVAIENRIKQILKDNFNIVKEKNDKIFFDLDSINIYKYLLILEKEFNIELKNEEIITVDMSIINIYKKINDII